MFWHQLHDVWFQSITIGISILAGLIASISGFGIGSLLTPFLSLSVGTKIAIALVAIPHFIGTCLRLWLLRQHIDKKVFIQFGIASILGGLLGAFLFSQIANPALTLVFGLVLLSTSLLELSGVSKYHPFGKKTALAAGLFSGFLGGLVGNQGGIRSAALLSLHIHQTAFVATATAIGLVVDIVRLPIYLASQWNEVLIQWPTIVRASLGVVIGTLIGIIIPHKIPQQRFKQIVAILVGLLGILIIVQWFLENNFLT